MLSRLLKRSVLTGALALGTGLAMGVPDDAAKSKSDIVGFVQEVDEVFQKTGVTYNKDTMKAAVLGALMKSLDASGTVYTEKAFSDLEEQNKGWFQSPGFWLTRKDGEYRIGGFLPSQAIEGVVEGDTLLSVEGQDLESMSVSEVLDHIRGQDRDKIALMIRKKNGKINEVETELSRVRLPSIYASEPMNDALAYLRLNGIYEDAGKTVVEAFGEFKKEKRFGVILDLRGAGGSDLASVVEIAGQFADKEGFLFSFRNQDEKELDSHQAKGDGGPIGLPVMVLIDHNTREAAELLTAVLKGSCQGALVIGEPSYGNPMVSEKVPLTSGEVLLLPTKRLLLSRGTTFDGRSGVEPNLFVSAESIDTDYQAAYDPQEGGLNRPEIEANHRLLSRLRGDMTLKRATDVLLGLKALNIQTRASASN